MNNFAVVWLRLARELCLKVNLAHWLDRSAVPLVIAAGAAAAQILVTRHHWPDSNQFWSFAVAIALPLVAMGWSFIITRKNFIGVKEALIRLESHHHIHAALSTAVENAGEWPPPPKLANDGLQWQWTRACLPLALAIGLVATAWSLPIADQTTSAGISEPAAWNVVETDLETLINKRVVNEVSTEQTKKAIDALRARPQSQWFDHSSIEASDRLLKRHKNEMSGLEERLRDTARALREAQAQQQGIQPGRRAENSWFDDELAGLRMGTLTPDKGLLEKLSKLAGENGEALNQINPRQLAEMLDQLDKNAEALSKMLENFKNMPGQNKPCEGQGCDGNCDNKACEGNPKGGQGKPQQDGGEPQRGPGEGGPLAGEEKKGPDAKSNSPLPAGDLSRSTPGDWVGVGKSKHNNDPNASPELRDGGAPTQTGDGGAAVWSDSLHPKEQEALRKFFE